MQILHLVLYSNEERYHLMCAATKPWYELIQKKYNVVTYYYMYDENITAPIIEGMLLKIPGKESYIPGILDKTIKALELTFFKAEYDVVIRSNVSSVINWPLMIKTLTRDLVDIYYAGATVISANSVHHTHGNVNAKDLPVEFAHGTCIILRADAVLALLNNLHLLNNETIDDVSLGVFFGKKTTTSTLLPPIRDFMKEVREFNANTNIDNVLVFRNHTYHSNRYSDLQNIHKQVFALKERYFDFPAHIRVEKVFYFSLDITEHILELCTEKNTWISSGNNSELDEMFGDPAPNVLKRLIVLFANGHLFSQNAILQFKSHPNSNHLFVE